MSGKYECLMRLEGFKVNIGLFNLLLLVAILSCMDDTFTNNTTAKGTFISIRGIGVQSSTHQSIRKRMILYFLPMNRIIFP